MKIKMSQKIVSNSKTNKMREVPVKNKDLKSCKNPSKWEVKKDCIASKKSQISSLRHTKY